MPERIPHQPRQLGDPAAIATFEALPPLGLAYLLAADEAPVPLLVVTTHDDRASRLAADVRALRGQPRPGGVGTAGTAAAVAVTTTGGTTDVACFLASDDIYAGVRASSQDLYDRLTLRAGLQEGQRPHIVIATVAALMGRWMPAADFQRLRLELHLEQRLPRVDP